jgi:hypothetical protein
MPAGTKGSRLPKLFRKFTFLPTKPAMRLLPPPVSFIRPEQRSRPFVPWLGKVLLVFVPALSFAVGWFLAPSLARSPSPGDRARALRFADEAARHAYADNLRQACVSAARARHANPRIPGMELMVAQMLFNAGHPAAAGSYARAALQRGDASSSAALVLGLEAWSQRGVDPLSFAHAGLVSRLWLEHAATETLSDGAARFFLAEIGRKAGRSKSAEMTQALYRFQPWESSAILDAKMHLAAGEAGPEFRAAHLGRGLSLDASPQSRAVKSLQRFSPREAGFADAQHRLTAVFTPRQAGLILRDPALADHALHGHSPLTWSRLASHEFSQE